MHKDWCGNPCGECAKPCALDESMPCSPCCDGLSEDGEILDWRACVKAGCDAILFEEK